LDGNRILYFNNPREESGYVLYLNATALGTWKELSQVFLGSSAGKGMHSPPGVCTEHYIVYQTQIVEQKIQFKRLNKNGLAIAGSWEVAVPFQPPHGVIPASIYFDKVNELPNGPFANLMISQVLSSREEIMFFLEYRFFKNIKLDHKEEIQTYVQKIRLGETIEILDFKRTDGMPLHGLAGLSEPFFFYQPDTGLRLTSMAGMLERL
jgi:hypothetical protein